MSRTVPVLCVAVVLTNHLMERRLASRVHLALIVLEGERAFQFYAQPEHTSQFTAAPNCALIVLTRVQPTLSNV